jgi:hypothetical protein
VSVPAQETRLILKNGVVARVRGVLVVASIHAADKASVLFKGSPEAGSSLRSRTCFMGTCLQGAAVRLELVQFVAENDL